MTRRPPRRWLKFSLRGLILLTAGVALFLGVHLGLHVALSGRPEYLFDSGLSQFLIYAGGLAGFVYLVMRLRRRQP